MHRQVFFVAAAVALLECVLAGALAAQDPMHDMPGMGRPDSSQTHQRMTGPLGIPMDRMGSGTTWIPDAVPLPAAHYVAGSWDLMLHGWFFLQYDVQGGPRGDEQFGSLNWAMLMASRPFAGGRITGRSMLSLDPATVTGRGYPLLVQTGETWQGQELVDRQHPHDFWMELAAQYERALSPALGASLYVAPSGEPALSPVAFMHRPSAMDDPVAPLSHHWVDATHISFGVVTLGLFGRRWKLEGSAFNGREPDEERWGFDELRLDSWSARLTLNPDRHWSFSLGHGYLKSPEALAPAESVRRSTAAAMYGRSLGGRGQLAASLIWGRNAHQDGDASHALLLEGEAISGKNTVMARAELVEKSAEDLALPAGPGGFAPDSVLRVGALSLGYIRELGRTRGASLGVGVRGTMNVVPAALEPVYDSRRPLGAFVFLRVRAAGGTP